MYHLMASRLSFTVHRQHALASDILGEVVELAQIPASTPQVALLSIIPEFCLAVYRALISGPAHHVFIRGAETRVVNVLS